MESKHNSNFRQIRRGRPKKQPVCALSQWVDWWRDMKRFEGRKGHRPRKRPPDLRVPSQAELVGVEA